MFRAAANDVLVLRRNILIRSTFIARYSRPHSSRVDDHLKHSSAAPPPLQQNASQRKATTSFRPAPVRPANPSTLSKTHTPLKPTHTLPRPTDNSSSLGELKETAKRDIEEAEAHGVLVPPPSGANWFQKTLHKGIQLAKFYYRGVRLIVLRRKEIAAIQARIRAGGFPLTRWENRLIRTQRDDVNKVVPFLFIALLLEEVIPLIAIYAPFMLPSTCILPSQRARIEEKKTEKALAFATNYRHIFRQLKSQQNPPGHLSLDALRQPGASIAVCGILRLSTSGFDALRIRRIIRHLKFLAVDDQLLTQNNEVQRLSEQGLNEALEERGIIIQGLTPKAKLNLLRWWLESLGTLDSETRRLWLIASRQ